jgi:hypothetical protein
MRSATSSTPAVKAPGKEVTRMLAYPVMGEVFTHQTRLLLRA